MIHSIRLYAILFSVIFFITHSPIYTQDVYDTDEQAYEEESAIPLEEIKAAVKTALSKRQFNKAFDLIQDIPDMELNQQGYETKQYLIQFNQVQHALDNRSGLLGKETDLEPVLQKTIQRLFIEAQASLIDAKPELAKDLLIHVIYLHRRNFRARELLKRCLNLKTGRYKVQNMENKYWSLSGTQFYGGNYEKAVESLLIYNLISPDNAEAYERLGSCYYMQNKKKEAIESWSTALFLNPDKKELDKIIIKTQAFMDQEEKELRERRKKKKVVVKQEEVPEEETQLLGVFPSRTQAYSYAQKLQRQGLKALINELDNGKWSVRVAKTAIQTENSATENTQNEQ